MRRKASVLELEHLYALHYGQYVRVASAIAGDIESGRDSVHGAFVSAVRSLDSYRGEGLLEAWVWRLVVNDARKERRRRSTRHELPLGEVTLPESAAGGAEESGLDDVRALITRLPERQRIALFLRYYVDLDYRAIAEILQISEGTVAASLHAAHSTLRDQLKERQLP